jgi:hypothetical protein
MLARYSWRATFGARFWPEILLPSGEPHGIRIAEIITRILKVMTSGTQPG